VLAKLTEVRMYSWNELQERPLPEGVDPQRLEMYLADSDFEVSVLPKLVDWLVSRSLVEWLGFHRIVTFVFVLLVSGY